MNVKIRTWDEMKSIYGLDEDGDIDVPKSFLIEMEESLPENRVISVRLDRHSVKWDAPNRHTYELSSNTLVEMTRKELEALPLCDLKLLAHAYTGGYVTDKEGELINIILEKQEERNLKETSR